ncbi:MAG: hypothetical protein A2664_04345 [Candidatus Taylorbacteria bacterium RIFCSPHIGHO2_01_FULL_46_22b]|uniref:Uncharacterized protein n=1 Tax=Candidatus Taylorbacteria bacterium RIFCSPHIGHO2_01_FULL_46_22b TaxID=1802301 RepID=A0A1G2M1V5_9BACT|nr:MAG: hypothetical protein A2664_04345 [Candidatus Taylorbacteria bacterium RIFCSPHIGHO2_01_FULL_46_22b]
MENFDIKQHTTPNKLEHYSFIWSEVRLVIAAIALFLGGYPVIFFVLPISPLYGLLTILLKLAWIISGAASGYLLYRWAIGTKTVFGGKDSRDTTAFFISVVSGINLGITGLLGTNIGMSISSSKLIFILVGILYLLAAVHLFRRWNSSGRKII